MADVLGYVEWRSPKDVETAIISFSDIAIEIQVCIESRKAIRIATQLRKESCILGRPEFLQCPKTAIEYSRPRRRIATIPKQVLDIPESLDL